VWILLAITGIASGGAVLCRKREASDQTDRDVTAEEARLFAGTAMITACAGFAGFLWLAGLPTQPWYFVPLMALVAACFDAGLPALPRLVRVAFFGFVAATAL